MTKRGIRRAAMKVARLLGAMVKPALLPSEHKEYMLAMLRVIEGLLESCDRQAGRERVRGAKPSMN